MRRHFRGKGQPLKVEIHRQSVVACLIARGHLQVSSLSVQRQLHHNEWYFAYQCAFPTFCVHRPPLLEGSICILGITSVANGSTSWCTGVQLKRYVRRQEGEGGWPLSWASHCAMWLCKWWHAYKSNSTAQLARQYRTGDTETSSQQMTFLH